MRWFKKSPPQDDLSYGRIFPVKKPRDIILHDIISAIATAISSMASIFSPSTVIGISIGGTVYGISGSVLAALLSVTISMGVSMAANAIFGKDKKSDASVLSNGRIFNTRSTSQPLVLHYGISRIGGNCVYEL